MILLTAFYSGNEEHAIEHFCQQVDWVFDVEPLKCAREISSDRSRISHYAAKKNLNVGGRKTFFDSLKYNFLNKKAELEKEVAARSQKLQQSESRIKQRELQLNQQQSENQRKRNEIEAIKASLDEQLQIVNQKQEELP